MNNPIKKPFLYGALAIIGMLGMYFSLVSLISGWVFMLSQFSRFWYFIISLAVGFGIQIGLFTYLKSLIHGSHHSGKMVALTGTTSTAAMISCCAHYLVNILPFLGATAFATIVSQYQIQFFWLGLLFNFVGVAFITSRIIKFYRSKK